MLSVTQLSKYFNRGWFRFNESPVPAVDGVSFQLCRGKTLGIVGESGSGKSTLARLLPGLLKPDNGSVVLNGAEMTTMTNSALIQARRKIQVISQHPLSSFNPLHRIEKSMNEPFVITRGKGPANESMLVGNLEQVDLPPNIVNRYPHEVSGGELQRLSIARALSLEPDYLILDEATSMLDVSTQARILHLLRSIQEKLEVGFIFISHDLDVAAFMSDELAIMHHGQFIEHGSSEQVMLSPQHKYTYDLINYFKYFHGSAK